MNRYSDILTYGKTRVKLIGGGNEQEGTDYINACFVNSPFEKISELGMNITGD